MEHDNLIIRPKHIRGEDGYKTFSIRIKEKTVAAIDRIVSQTDRSRNELIGMFLEYAIEHCEVRDDKGDTDTK